MCESLEIWEKMIKEGCIELLAESKTTLRQLVNRPNNDPPYVHKWIMEELPISSDLMWVEDTNLLSKNAGGKKSAGDLSKCFELEEGTMSDCNSSDQPDIQAVKWDEIDKKLAELRNKDRFF